MSQENVEIVKVAYEALAREGLDRFIEHFTDDVEYRVLRVRLTATSIRSTAGMPFGHGSKTGSTCSMGSGSSWWS